jgi:MYXO-CTERM domain-containing protein
MGRQIVAVALVLLASVSTTRAQQLVLNGGFEDGYYTSFSDWTIETVGNTGSNCGRDYYAWENGGAHSGSCVAAFSSSEGDDVLSQSIQTVEGQSYRLDFWLKKLGNAANPYDFSASWGDSILTLGNAPQTSEWTEYTYNVTATGFTAPLAFSGQGGLFLDDVSVTPTPEPSTFVLLAIVALGGLFAWRRRRQAA